MRFYLVVLFGLFQIVSLPNTYAESAKFDLTDYQGQVVYVDFWASWCGPCRASFPFMNQMHQRYGDKGLRVIGINVDNDKADADVFLKAIPAQFAILYDADGALAREFGVAGMPNSFLFDREGKLIETHVGFRKDDPPQIEAMIKQALQ